jgi:hypothetical protein
MRRIFIVTYPDGKQIAYSSFNHVADSLISVVGLKIILEYAKELKDAKPNRFSKTEFIPFKKEINGYRIESVQLIAGSLKRNIKVSNSN